MTPAILLWVILVIAFVVEMTLSMPEYFYLWLIAAFLGSSIVWGAVWVWWLALQSVDPVTREHREIIALTINEPNGLIIREMIADNIGDKTEPVLQWRIGWDAKRYRANIDKIRRDAEMVYQVRVRWQNGQ